jgi:vancomycin resistance protein YoaR
MGKIVKFMFVFLLLCFVVACQEESLSSKDDKEIPTSIQQPQNEGKPVPTVEEYSGSNDEGELGTILIKDARTMEVVKEIKPMELGYELIFEMYLDEIMKIAKELARGTKTTVGFDELMVLDKVDANGQIIKGKPRVILNENELVNRILAVSNSGGIVYLPIEVTESNYEIEDVPELDDITVASFTTYFNPSQTGRNKNIELSSAALDNIIVGDGDFFSFNTMVGERSAARGYQPAPEIINKKRVMGIGGGICQTSSTLFNAVDQVDVRISERHHHSLNVGYVPVERDATVSYGTLDFKFQNMSGAPFLIKTFYYQNGITIEIRTARKYEGYFIVEGI